MPDEDTTPEAEVRSLFSSKFPDAAICHTSAIGPIESFCNCCVERFFTCAYSVISGKIRFCTHPNWKEFVRK